MRILLLDIIGLARKVPRDSALTVIKRLIADLFTTGSYGRVGQHLSAMVNSFSAHWRANIDRAVAESRQLEFKQRYPDYSQGRRYCRNGVFPFIGVGRHPCIFSGLGYDYRKVAVRARES
jgi:hypothetical protein